MIDWHLTTQTLWYARNLGKKNCCPGLSPRQFQHAQGNRTLDPEVELHLAIGNSAYSQMINKGISPADSPGGDDWLKLAGFS